MDKFRLDLSEAWPDWMARMLREAEFTLMVCDSTYKAKLIRASVKGSREGQGVKMEGRQLLQYLHDQGSMMGDKKILPILLTGCSVEDIPRALKGFQYYDLSGEKEGEKATTYEVLLRRLLYGQVSDVEVPVVGSPGLGRGSKKKAAPFLEKHQ